MYLAFAMSKGCNRNSSLCLWEHRMDRLVATFGRQALPMVWDFAETNPIAGAGGDIFGTVKSVSEVIQKQFYQEQHAVASHIGCSGPMQYVGTQSGRFYRSPLLRQHRLRRSVRLFLRLAAPLTEVGFPGSVRHARRSQSRRTRSLPYRHGSKGSREVLPQRHDPSNAPTIAGAGASLDSRSPSTTPSSNRRARAVPELQAQAGRPSSAP